jgi:hypothetical protein
LYISFYQTNETSLTYVNSRDIGIFKIIGHKMAKGGYSGIVSDARMTVKSGDFVETNGLPENTQKNYTVTFDSPMPDDDYMVSVSFSNKDGESMGGFEGYKWAIFRRKTTGFTIGIWPTNNITGTVRTSWIAIRPNSYTREGMVEDVLYTTSTGFTTGTINLSGNISDYDLIEFVIGDSTDGEKYTNNRVYSSSVLTNIMGQQNKFFFLAYYGGGWQMFSVDSDNQLSCSNRSGNTVLYKITGIKFGRYVSGVAVDTTVT